MQKIEKLAHQILREFAERDPGGVLDLARRVAANETLPGIEFLTADEQRVLICDILRIESGQKVEATIELAKAA